MLERVYQIVLLLNITYLFPFIAPLIGTDISTISQGILVINLIYLWIHRKYTIKLLRKKSTVYWVIFLLIWPVFTIIYAPEINIRAIGLKIYFISLFLGTSIYVYINGWKQFYNLFKWALIITVIGFILSLINPSFFEKVAILSDHKTEYHSRAYGFFMQPNRAAAATIFIFIIYYCNTKVNTLISIYNKNINLINFNTCYRFSWRFIYRFNCKLYLRN